MSFQSTALIARKSIRARIGRLIAISIAILVGVSFVVGSFVLADSLRQTFDDLFTQISQNVDLQVRVVGGLRRGRRQRPARPDPGRRWPTRSPRSTASRPSSPAQRYAQLVDQDGEADHDPGRADARRGLDRRTSRCPGLVIKGEGAAPSGPDQVAIDKATADREDFAVGDQIKVITDTGTRTFTITALVGLGDSDGFAGATLAAWDVATAQQVFGTPRPVRRRRRRRSQEGADPATVNAAIEEILPAGTEVVTARRHRSRRASRASTRSSAPSATGLLGFAFVTAFVSAFLINNVFQITIGQRLRELALMRAVGAIRQAGPAADLHRGAGDGGRRHVLGIGGGILVARGLISRVQLGRRRVPGQRDRAAPADDPHGLPRRRRHHDAVGDRPGPPGGQDPARSRRCGPSSASRRSAPGGSSSARSSPSSAR